MENRLETIGMLDLIVRPGFCVKDHIIVKVNPAAEALMLAPGTDIRTLLLTGKQEYADFQEGCLYLTLSLGTEAWGASVTKMEDFHVFLLEQEQNRSELQAMALAARELRTPLANVMSTAELLFPMSALQEDPAIRDYAGRMNRGLMQMLRIIGNMSDAHRYATDAGNRMETRDVGKLFQEIFDHSAELLSYVGLKLTFRNLSTSVSCLVDSEKLERSVLNILSNATKFTPKGGSVDCSLTLQGTMLYLQIQDNGSGIADNIKGSIHSRYLRQIGIEDGDFGIGLGMVLVHSTAALHGGTVLVDHPKGQGTRITMTLAIRQNSSGTLRSKLFRTDYCGERDHGLLELSESLPASLYEKN